MRKILSMLGLALRKDLEEAWMDRDFFRSERSLFARAVRNDEGVRAKALCRAIELCDTRPQELAEGDWGPEGVAMAKVIRRRILEELRKGGGE